MTSESYLQESEWFHYSCKPKFQEQVNVSTVSIGPQIAATAMLMGMGDEATRDAFEWALRGDTAVMSFGWIARFLNDIASFNVEFVSISFFDDHIFVNQCSQSASCGSLIYII